MSSTRDPSSSGALRSSVLLPVDSSASRYQVATSSTPAVAMKAPETGSAGGSAMAASGKTGKPSGRVSVIGPQSVWVVGPVTAGGSVGSVTPGVSPPGTSVGSGADVATRVGPTVAVGGAGVAVTRVAAGAGEAVPPHAGDAQREGEQPSTGTAGTVTCRVGRMPPS